jgi:integrase
VTENSVTTYHQKRRVEGASTATVRLELAVLKRGWRLLKLGNVPFTMPTVPDNRRMGFLEDHEIDAVIGHLPDYLAPMVRFLSLTGWRLGEARRLTWANVDLANGIVRLSGAETKSGEPRGFPAHQLPELWELLKGQRAYTDETQRATDRIINLVFHNAGKPIQSPYYAWEKATTAARCPDKIIHDLRRSAARKLVRLGIPESVVKKLCGWTRESAMLSRYDITSERDVNEAVAKLAVATREPSKIARIGS